MRSLWVAALGTAALTGCADFQFNLAVNSTAAVLKKGSKSLEMESDVDLARDALPGTLKTIDSFSAAAPDQPILLELTTQAYVQYAFGFLEDDLEQLKEGDPRRAHLVERATGLYDRARAYGMHLAQVSGGGKNFEKEFATAPDKALGEVNADGAPGLYWAGLAQASAINLHRDDPDRVAELPRAIALIERAYALAPNYYNHGPALALGVLFASTGKAMGGDPERAKKLFDEVVHATDGKFLMALVLYARFYATITQDRALFESTLKHVLDTPASVWPEQRLANELARRRAARYLKMADDLF